MELKTDLALMALLKELKASTNIEQAIDKKFEEFHTKYGIVHTLTAVLGEEKFNQLVNDNVKCWLRQGSTYEKDKEVFLPKIDIHFSLVDGKGDSVICLTLVYHTDTKKWEREYSGNGLYDSYEDLIKGEFDGGYEYYHDYATIYL